MDEIIKELKKDLLNKEISLKELNAFIMETFGQEHWTVLHGREDYCIKENEITYFLRLQYLFRRF